MADADPTVEIVSLLVNQWDASTTALADPPEFHTGRWARDDQMPVIAVHGLNSSGALSGGETGLTATHGPTGKPMQMRTGYVLVDCVAGTRAECDSVGPNGSPVNPKKVRHDLKNQVNQILLDHRPSSLNSLSPGPGNDMADSSDEEDIGVSYRHQLRAKFTRRHVPTA